jgi:hypothetical protein
LGRCGRGYRALPLWAAGIPASLPGKARFCPASFPRRICGESAGAPDPSQKINKKAPARAFIPGQNLFASGFFKPCSLFSKFQASENQAAACRAELGSITGAFAVRLHLPLLRFSKKPGAPARRQIICLFCTANR